MKPYIPDFKLAFEHVCIHTGGRGVVEEIEKQLAMTPALMQPSKDTLFRYGNTSSSSIWCARAHRHIPALLLQNYLAGCTIGHICTTVRLCYPRLGPPVLWCPACML